MASHIDRDGIRSGWLSVDQEHRSDREEQNTKQQHGWNNRPGNLEFLAPMQLSRLRSARAVAETDDAIDQRARNEDEDDSSNDEDHVGHAHFISRNRPLWL